jgi:hypothetical protein
MEEEIEWQQRVVLAGGKPEAGSCVAGGRRWWGILCRHGPRGGENGSVLGARKIASASSDN